MPTALEVDVEDAITPPNVVKKSKKTKSNSEGNKITPVPSTGASKSKKSKQKAAQQPSIMTFFNQPSSKNLFKSNTEEASSKKSDNKGESTAADPSKPAAEAPSKPPMPQNKSSVPTPEEIREIVLGSSSANKNLDDVVVPEPIDLPPGAEEDLLPIVPIPSPSRLETSSSMKKATTESNKMKNSLHVPAKDGSVVETADMNGQEEANQEESTTHAADENEESATEPSEEQASGAKDTSVMEKENLGLDNNGEHQGEEEDDDDETVDMSPVKQTLANATNSGDEEVPKEITAKEDASEEATKTRHENESGKTEEGSSMDCVDLTVDDAPAAAKSAPKKAKKTPAKKGPAKPPKKPEADSKPAAVPDGISAERQAALAKNATLRSQYQSRLDGLIQRAHDGLSEENFTLPVLEPVETLPEEGTAVSSPSEFPECAISSLALLVQESRLSLTDLAATTLIQLKEAYPDQVEFHAEGIAAKIKLVATREPYVQVDSSRITNAFEDENADRMWRWEIVSLEILPDDCVSKIKKARMARKKLRSHSKALCLLLKYLDQSNKLLLDPKSTQAKCDDLTTKISSAEQKVLKYEREEEKVRLAAEAKRQKEAAKGKEQNSKGKGKGNASAAEQKKREKELKKQAAAKEREEKKREKELKKQEREEKKRKKEEEKQKEQLEKERKVKKQRTMMESMFKSSNSKPSASQRKEKPASTASVDSNDFWSRLNKSDKHAGPLFPTLSSRALASRKRRTRVVPVQVFTTVTPSENPFDAQQYAELQTIHVPNKYKFLCFSEDLRPPYHGTWSKTSSLVTGRKPIAKDTEYLDYDNDSEAEWEEGDDEVGEDCEADGPDEEDNMDDDEGDTRMYNYEDGWLAADDDLGIADEEVDEDTKLLRKKLHGSSQQKAIADQATICIIAPGKGGIPSDDLRNNVDGTERLEGVNPSVARDLLFQHTGRVLSSEGFVLDAFPPPLVEEGNLDTTSPKVAKAATSNEMSRADLITFVEFVHHSEFPSKEKLVEDLRTVHKTVTASRAQAQRKLDSVAEKKRYPGGVYWEVRREILAELGLEELMKKEYALPPPKPSNEKKPKASTTSGSAKSTTPASAKASKKKKASPTGGAKTPAAAKETPASSIEKTSAKKRPAENDLKASAKLFANFLGKKPKTDK